MTQQILQMRHWKRRRNTQGWNVMCWRRGFGFLFPLPPHICHCLFLSPPRLECRSAPPLSRPRTSVSAAVAFNASALPPRGILVRPRASVAVYLCACFPLPPSVGLQRRRISCAPRLSRRIPVAPVSLCRHPLASNAVEFRAPRASVAVYLLRPFPSAAVRWPPTPFNFVRLSRRLPVAPVLLIRRPLVDAAVVLPAPPRLRCATRKS